jgi:single-strand DNA-binding protein
MSNVFSFTGRLGRDAEMKSLPSGTSLLTCNVANDVGYGDKKTTLWVTVNVFGKRAEGRLVDFLRKGQQVFVSGELNIREYQGGDGTTKKITEVTANVVELIGGLAPTQAAADYGAAAAASRSRASSPPDYDDDIPF